MRIRRWDHRKIFLWPILRSTKISAGAFWNVSALCGTGAARRSAIWKSCLAEYAPQKEILFFTLYSVFRDLALSARYGEEIPLQNVPAAGEIRKLSEKIGYHDAMDCIGRIGSAWRLIGQNVNYRLAADALAIRIQEVIHHG